MKNTKHSLFFLLMLLFSCGSEENSPSPQEAESNKIIGLDLSFAPELEQEIDFKNSKGEEKDILEIAKTAGCNTVRLRLWKDPKNKFSGFEEVKAFSSKIKKQGLKVWLTVHYSDTWADPGAQKIPSAWVGLSLSELEKEISDYTSKIVREIRPEYIQIGNEINDGFLWGKGRLNEDFDRLATSAIKAVRAESSQAKIMLHFAGIDNSDWFFGRVKSLDYDIIGLSYYPIHHGKDLQKLENTIQNLGNEHDKPVIIAETAYPFTLGWNDYTNNVVGLENQLISGFPATETGQAKFLRKIKEISTSSEKAIGFCYWGAEYVASKGDTATNGSSWENQALFDFNFQATEALRVLGEK